jgi:hypothetical protein
VLAPFDLEPGVMFFQQVGKAAAAIVGFVEGRVQPFDHRPDGRLEHPFVAVSQGDLFDGLGDQFGGVLDGGGFRLLFVSGGGSRAKVS